MLKNKIVIVNKIDSGDYHDDRADIYISCLKKENLDKLREMIYNKTISSGIDLNGEENGILFNLDKVGPVELATTSFGQGVSVTAIQQVQAVSAIINNGNMYTPYIVSRITNGEGKNVLEKEPALKKKNLIKKDTSSLVRYALESVVAKGSGHNAYVEGYRIGGKTGTAQKVGSDGRYMVGNYILSFIGFMPADDPEYVVYIALDGAKGVTQYGGTASAPIAKSIFEAIINLNNLEPQSEGIPKEYTWLDTKYITLPDVVGLSKKEAIKNSRKRERSFN